MFPTIFTSFAQEYTYKTFVESLNNVVNMARDKLIYNLLEEIRDKLTKCFVNRKKEADKWKGKIAPYIKEQLATFQKDC